MSKFQFNDMIDDIVAEYRKKVEQALMRAEAKIKIEMEKIIQEYMIDDYYGGYTPKMYVRIFQLPKSVGPYTKLAESGNVFGLAFGVDVDSPYGPGAMDHSELTVIFKAGRKPTILNRSGDVNEDFIFENFLAGIHPNVGRANTSHIEERVSKRLDLFLTFDAVDIVNGELNKIQM